MGKGSKGQCQHRKERRQIACILCTVVLVIIIIVLVILYFTIFKPKDPGVQVPTMQLLSFNEPGNSSASVTSVSLILNLQVSIYNPNRATFHVEDGSTACLYYYGSQIAFASVPQVAIPSQSFADVAVALSMQGLNPNQGTPPNDDAVAGILPLTTAVTIIGHVTTLNIFSHHSDVVSKCQVNISLSARGIQAFTCQRSYSLDE